MSSLVHSRWFSLADLVFVSISIILWELEPKLGWRPLIIGLIPWFLRATGREFPFRRTSFDLPLAIFLAMAGVGVWAAYNQEAAWAKFWLLVGAVLLYYVFASQPQSNLWLFAGLLSLVGIGISVVFLLSNDWQVQPAKIGSLNQIGLWWMAVRPTLPVTPMHPNDVAGISAIMAPLLFAFGGRAWQEKRILTAIGAAAAVGIVLASLVMTTSRGAWLALGAAVVTGLLWVGSGQLARWLPIRRSVIFGLAILLLAGIGIGLTDRYANALMRVGDSLPVSFQALNRLEVAQGAVDLIGDFPFTGGGLDAFPGLYAQYILITPNYIIPYSHNIFLDVAFEQGILGFLTMTWVLLGSLWLLVKQGDGEPLLRWAVLAGLFVMMVHGLVDDIVYSTQHTPLLFLLPGMAVALTQTNQPQAARLTEAGHRPWSWA